MIGLLLAIGALFLKLGGVVFGEPRGSTAPDFWWPTLGPSSEKLTSVPPPLKSPNGPVGVNVVTPVVVVGSSFWFWL